MKSNPNRIKSFDKFPDDCTVMKNVPGGKIFLCCDKHGHGRVHDYWNSENSDNWIANNKSKSPYKKRWKKSRRDHI